MSKTMRAAVVHDFDAPLKIEERAIPSPGPGEVLIRIMASGVCHTDVHAASGDWPVKPKMPLVPGHEGVGYVAALGAGVKGLKEGDIAGIAWLHDACGSCDYCETGWETLCGSQHNSGYSVDGCYADYAIGSAAYVAKLPDRCNMAAMAPILCAGVTTYKGIKETEARPGEWLAVSGIGGLGHVAVQYAKAMGLHVVALDVAADQLALARSLGADLVFDARDEELATRIVKETQGGVHGALVTAVSAQACAQALSILRPKGTASFVGLPRGSFPTPIFDVVLKRLTLRGSIVGTRKDLQEAIAFAAEGKVKANIHLERLEDINRIFYNLKMGNVKGRAVLDLSGTDF